VQACATAKGATGACEFVGVHITHEARAVRVLGDACAMDTSISAFGVSAADAVSIPVWPDSQEPFGLTHTHMSNACSVFDCLTLHLLNTGHAVDAAPCGRFHVARLLASPDVLKICLLVSPNAPHATTLAECF
jgi:hypothetical protein